MNTHAFSKGAVAACIALSATVIHCSSDDSSTTTPAPATTTTTTNPSQPAPAPTTPATGAGAAAATTQLTVMNFLSWCSVSINGGAASTEATVSGTVNQGSMATIVVTPASADFQIGAEPWFGTDENNGGAAAGTDNGSGVTETSTATVTIGANATQCVSVCCQLPGNAPTPCPTTNPCGG